ncbi:MAG: extracellular solute-binding protein [Clostridia bacterium]|nr:extracellular solute-binding protein [Clostridia bacterium]
MKKVLSLVLAAMLLICLGAALAEEVKGPLVLYSSMTDNDIDNLIEAFNEIYPDVEVEVVNGSAGELEARARAEKDNPQGDVQWGGLSPSDGSANDDIFALYTSPYEEDLPAAYKSHNGRYNQDHLSTICFCVNVELEKELGLDIKTYEDLLNPALKGRIVLSDPNSSSAAWNNLCNIFAVYGNDSDEAWKILRGLLENGLVISTSSSVCFKSVDSGEYVVGLTYEDGADTLLKSGSTNIRIQYPENGASATSMGCAMIEGCPHPEAAKAMINFLMSPEGQTALANRLETLRFTNPKAEYELKWLPADNTINWVERDVPWLTEHKAELLDKWNALYAEINK